MIAEEQNEWTKELDNWMADFEAFHARFAHLYARTHTGAT